MNSVDVVIPCYNYARFLERCARSVLDQEEVDVRVLIIDDASSDHTPQVGQRLAAQDCRVEYRRHEVNVGHIDTYNEGLLGWASAEYSLLISADDLLTPGALERATQIMARHPAVGLTYGMARYVADDAPPEPRQHGAIDFQLIPGDLFVQRCFEHGNTVSTPTAVVRTTVQQAVGGYARDLPHSGDMEMWMRFGAHCPVGVVRAVQACYRWHGDNMSRRYRAAQLRDMKEVERACLRLLDRCGSSLPHADAWLAAMYRRFAEEAFWSASNAFDLGDDETFNVCLDYARQCRPEIMRTAMWWRLRAKAILGSTLWSAVRPAIDHLRGSPPRPEALWAPPPLGGQFGWWPEPEFGSGTLPC
ncbi:MAG: glycosyltransferase family A protein [Geminicoccaceae bacterium]